MEEKNYDKPSVIPFLAWLDEWQNTTNVNKYNIHLAGAFCQNYCFGKAIDTNDVDIIVEVNVEDDNIDYYELKHILEQAEEIGFKHRLLIDVYASEPWKTFGKVLQVRNFVDKFIKVIKDDAINTNSEISPTSLFAKELIPGLWEFHQDSTDVCNKYLATDYEALSKQILWANNGS